MGILAAQLGEFLRVFQKCDDLFQFFLGLFDAGDIFKSDLPLRFGQQLGAALAERHGLAAPHLHLAHEEDPDPDQQNQREPGDEYREPGEFFLFRLGVDRNLLLQQFLGQVGIGMVCTVRELLAVLAL